MFGELRRSRLDRDRSARRARTATWSCAASSTRTSIKEPASSEGIVPKKLRPRQLAEQQRTLPGRRRSCAACSTRKRGPPTRSLKPGCIKPRENRRETGVDAAPADVPVLDHAVDPDRGSSSGSSSSARCVKRAAAAACCRFGRSRAKMYTPEMTNVTFSGRGGHRRGQGRSSRDHRVPAQRRRSSKNSAVAFRAASMLYGPPGCGKTLARQGDRRRSGAFRSSRSPDPTSSRCSSASAPVARA